MPDNNGLSLALDIDDDEENIAEVDFEDSEPSVINNDINQQIDLGFNHNATIVHLGVGDYIKWRDLNNVTHLDNFNPNVSLETQLIDLLNQWGLGTLELPNINPSVITTIGTHTIGNIQWIDSGQIINEWIKSPYSFKDSYKPTKIDDSKIINKIMSNYNITEGEATKLLEYVDYQTIIRKCLPLFINDKHFPVNRFYMNREKISIGIMYVIGYWYNGKIYNNPVDLNKDLIDLVYHKHPKGSAVWTVHDYKTLLDDYLSSAGCDAGDYIKPIIGVIRNNKLILVTNIKWNKSLFLSSASDSKFFNLLTKYFKIKIKSSELSTKVFGNAKSKEELVGKIFNKECYKIIETKSKNLENHTIWVISVTNDKDKDLKFIADDIEFIPINAVGYNFPKDKTIKIEDRVRIIADINKLNVNKNSIGFIRRVVKKNVNSKKINVDSSTRQLDLFEVDIEGKLYKIFGKYLKNY